MLERLNSKHDWKDKLYIIIFRSGTRKGKIFDICLLIVILLSVLVVLLDSVSKIHAYYGKLFHVLEWTFTFLFTIEYILRIAILEKKWKYILSIIGIVDLLAILPSYLGIFFAGYQYLIVLRSLRLLRVFRIFKLWRFMQASTFIMRALYSSYRKIMLFMLFLVLLVIIIGSLMYIIEARTPGFESIPNSIYWAVVTITTVGYGDVSPATPFGKFISVMVMLCGYSIIAVPTGILTSEMAKAMKVGKTILKCPRCGTIGHQRDARYCRICAESIVELENKNDNEKKAL